MRVYLLYVTFYVKLVFLLTADLPVHVSAYSRFFVRLFLVVTLYLAGRPSLAAQEFLLLWQSGYRVYQSRYYLSSFYLPFFLAPADPHLVALVFSH